MTKQPKFTPEELNVFASLITTKRPWPRAPTSRAYATAFIDTEAESQYGDHGMITQDVTRDERAAGTKGAILGNATVFWTSESERQAASAPAPAPAPATQGDNFDNDVPF